MTATYEESYDDILTVFKTAWDTTGFTAQYENLKFRKPTDETPWARVVIRHATGQQDSLSGGGSGTLFNRTGVMIASIFVPAGEGLQRAMQLAKIVANAYEGTTTPRQVWFRNVRTNEVGPSDGWFQVNVLVDFTYDEVKS